MSPDISERSFEEAIEYGLLQSGLGAYGETGLSESAVARWGDMSSGGYLRRVPDDYDRDLCLLPQDAIDFVLATQPKEWTRLKQHHGAAVKERFLQRLTAEIKQRGALDVLRQGIRDSGCRFQLAYFRPASGLNAETQRLYGANLFAIVRQLRYSTKNENSLDLVLFLNGIPIFTAELKNPLTGRNVGDAITQYKRDRDPREPLFAYGRCLAHFALDPDLVYVTTHLAGAKTRFLPFNQGRFGGAGNPPVPPTRAGYSTAYVWEQTWARDSVLDLIRQFIQEVEEEDEKGRKTGKRFLIFPRYQQLDCVRKLVADARRNGAGQRYLIEHSAGSGKSFTIAWLAHRLSTLHDASDRRVFDSIVVITDRRVLDRQLQATMRQFEQTLGVVENIDTISRQLKEALESGKTIIVTTLQKFPVIAKEIGELPGQRFAVIVDEAHSSQSGESTKSLKAVLASRSLAEAEAEESEAATPEEELEDIDPCRDGEARPAAEPLDLRLHCDAEAEDAGVVRPAARRREIRAVPPLQHAPGDRGGVHSRRAGQLHHLHGLLAAAEEDRGRSALRSQEGRIPAQIVCRTAPARDRREGPHLRRAFRGASTGRDRRQGEGDDRHPLAPPCRALQAGSRQIPRRARLSIQGAGRFLRHCRGRRPEVHRRQHERLSGDADREDLRAAGISLPDLRQQIPDRVRPAALHTMYVDKKLGGVNAVQTLSRLNRTHPEKTGTMVLDFANEAEEIKAAFEPYYEATLLSEATDPNLLYEVQTRLRAFPIYTDADVGAFAKVYFDPKATQDRLYAVLAPVVERFNERSRDERQDFRGQLTDYVRLYAFLSQVLTFADADLEKLYVFVRYLRRLLPPDRDELPIEVQQNIDMESYRIQQTGSGKIALDRKAGVLDPVGTKGGFGLAPEEIEALSRIIAELNERFGLNLGPEHRVTLAHMMEKLDDDAALEAAARVNTRENVRLTFDHKVENVIQEIVETNFDLYKRITDDAAFGDALKNFLFDQYVRGHRNAEELIKRGESKSLEFKSTLRWSLKEDRRDDKGVTHAALKTIAAFLNTEGGDLLIGVADDGSIVGIERDQLETDDKFMRHLAQVVRNGMGDRAGTCIDPKTQIVQGKTVCVVSCQRSPEPVFLKWKGIETTSEGDLFVRSGPGTVKLSPESAKEFIRTRFGSPQAQAAAR